MMKRGLLIGGHAAYLGKLAQEVRTEDIALFVATSLDDVNRIFDNETIDVVILGRESDPEYRLQVLRHIFAVSPTSSVHLMGKGDDPILFVRATLQGYSCQRKQLGAEGLT